MPDLPNGTVTFLFTDIEGSTTRWEQHREAMQAALVHHVATLGRRLRDLDIILGNLIIANQDMAAALACRDYDYSFVFGEGGHMLTHGGPIFPETIRWLWRDYPKGGQAQGTALAVEERG